MEFKLGAVEKAAQTENGWHAIAVIKDRHREGTLPNGVIAFVRNYPMQEDLRCGTAQWAINEAGVFFFSGHYDLKRDEAMADLVKRTANFIDDADALARV